MNRQRGLQAGIFVFLILTGCSKTDKKLNVEGAFSPVIENLRSAPEPPVRGDVNTLTAIVKNPRGYTIRYHWSASAGTVPDSTGETSALTGDTTLATVHWTAPPAIGDYPVTVTITARDDINNVTFVKTRTFYLHVDNEFVRWTRSIALQFDVVPPTAGKIYYSEVRNSGTGESDIWALATPLGSPEQITHDFWQTTQATVQSDGLSVVFMGKKHSSDGGASIYQLPPTGGDTTAASILLQWTSNSNHYVGGPRFAPTGFMIAYSNDTIPENYFYPKGWMRDAGNLATAPIPIMPTTTAGGVTERTNSYWNPAWRGAGDSLVMESYANFKTVNEVSRGLFKFSATGNPPPNPEPFARWLSDLRALEPDWSPDGQHIVFSKRSIGHTDRDIWIINAAASDPSAAVRVTFGPADDFHPRFSSDGSQIFFVSNRVDGYGANGVYDTERRGLNIWCVGRFDKP